VQSQLEGLLFAVDQDIFGADPVEGYLESITIAIEAKRRNAKLKRPADA